MLKLRRGVVVDTDPLTVEIDGERRPAWADSALVGEVADGDEVVVNTEAADLGLGSGGFDVVHVNLTRGLDGPGPAAGEHVMKLNYTSLQHPVEPVETPEAGGSDLIRGRLMPGARPAAPRPPGAERVGGGPRAAGDPARLRPDAPAARSPGRCRGTLRSFASAGCSPVTSPRAPAYGGEHEAITTLGALDAAAARPRVGRDHLRARPGDPRLGHDVRPRRDGGAGKRPRRARAGPADAALSTALELGPAPAASRAQPSHRGRARAAARARCASRCRRSSSRDGPRVRRAPSRSTCRACSTRCTTVCDDRHDVEVETVDLDGYAAERAPDADDGADDRRGPAVLRRARSPPAGRWPWPSASENWVWSDMERIGSKTVYEGRIATVRIDEFRYPDGSDLGARDRRAPRRGRDGRPRRALRLPGAPAARGGGGGRPARAAGRQARRPGRDRSSTAPSASSPRRSARAPREWRELKRFYTSPGFAEEEVTVYLATGLDDASAESDEEERLEVVRVAAGRPRRRDRGVPRTRSP